DYHKLPAGTPLESFSLELAERSRAALEKAAAQWSAIPARPGSREGEMARELRDFSIAPGEARAVDIEGEGVVRELRLQLAAPSPRGLRGGARGGAFDDRQSVCGRAPAGDFFGSGCGARRFASLPCGMTDDGYYAWWPMSFRSQALVSLRNDTAEP